VKQLVVAALIAAVGVAHADDKPARIPQKARELADKGRAYHDAGEYTKAIAAFKEAYVLAPSPALLFNIAQAYRLAGNCDDAAWMYRRYIDTNPDTVHKALAEQHLESVEKCGHGGLLVVTPPPVEGKVPEPPKEEASVTATTTSDEPPGTRSKQVALWVGIGGGVALAGAAYFALDASDASDNVSNLYKHGGKGTDVASQDARGQRSAALATVFGIGGGLALASAGVLYAVGRHYESAQHVAVAPHAHGAEVSLSWHF
jgi:tetratricopeptide (TPR) repeat protein